MVLLAASNNWGIELKRRRAYHGIPLDVVLGHDITHQWPVDFDHILAIGLFAQTGLSVAADW